MLVFHADAFGSGPPIHVHQPDRHLLAHCPEGAGSRLQHGQYQVTAYNMWLSPMWLPSGPRAACVRARSHIHAHKLIVAHIQNSCANIYWAFQPEEISHQVHAHHAERYHRRSITCDTMTPIAGVEYVRTAGLEASSQRHRASGPRPLQKGRGNADLKRILRT